MHSGSRFTDRAEAGKQVAQAIQDRAITVDIVLAIPRGGLPVGREVADELDVPLDIVVASKISAPHNSEFAIGAVGSDGSVWLDDETIDRLGIEESYLDRESKQETEKARRKAERYRGDRTPPELTDRSVCIVDDGIATGSTAIAATRVCWKQDPKSVIVAVPVAPPNSVSELETVADSVIAVWTPTGFRAVGQYYENFDQVSDETAIAMLTDDDRSHE